MEGGRAGKMRKGKEVFVNGSRGMQCCCWYAYLEQKKKMLSIFGAYVFLRKRGNESFANFLIDGVWWRKK